MSFRGNLLGKGFFGGAVLVFVAIFVLGFCMGEAHAKDTLIVGVPSTPTGIDPDVNAEPAGSDIQGNLYDWGISLKFKKSEQPGMEDIWVPDFMGALQPALIESWEVAPDRSKATFHLRKGVKSPWGNEFTTKDIVWKWERNLALKANGAFMLGVINCNSRENLKVIDDYTFEVIPSDPAFLVDTMWSNLYFPIWDSTEAKKHVTSDDPWAHDWIATHGDGYGPYYIKEWVAGQQIVLEANPSAWRGAPPISKLIFKVIPESSSRVAMVKDGTIDVAMKLSPREIDSLKGAQGVKVVNLQGNIDLHLVLNQGFKPFENKLVRQAIQWAIPQDDIAKLAFYGQAIPWKATVPSMYPSVVTTDFLYSYDLEQSKKLLQEAGFSEGFEVDLYYDADFASHETAGILLKDNLAKVGIKVNLRKTPSGAFNTGVLGKKYPFALWNDYPVIADPFYSFHLMYLSTNFHCYANYSNPEMDKLLIEGNKITDPEKRYAAAREVNGKLLDYVAYGMVVEQNYTAAIRDNLRGFNWDVGNNVRYDLISFAE